MRSSWTSAKYLWIFWCTKWWI